MAEESRSKRNWIILLILLLLLVIGIVLYLYFIYFAQPAQPIENINQAANVNATQNTNTNNNTNTVSKLPPGFENLTPQEQEQQKKESEVLFFAMPFAERLGTYSNQSNFVNLDELEPLMTVAMNNWVQNTYKVDLQKKYAAMKYYGIETKAISSDFNTIDESKAEVLVKTQRSEYQDSPTNPKIFYQDILLKLVKQDNAWKVDGAYWQ